MGSGLIHRMRVPFVRLGAADPKEPPVLIAILQALPARLAPQLAISVGGAALAGDPVLAVAVGVLLVIANGVLRVVLRRQDPEHMITKAACEGVNDGKDISGLIDLASVLQGNGSASTGSSSTHARRRTPVELPRTAVDGNSAPVQQLINPRSGSARWASKRGLVPGGGRPVHERETVRCNRR